MSIYQRSENTEYSTDHSSFSKTGPASQGLNDVLARVWEVLGVT